MSDSLADQGQAMRMPVESSRCGAERRYRGRNCDRRLRYRRERRSMRAPSVPIRERRFRLTRSRDPRRSRNRATGMATDRSRGIRRLSRLRSVTRGQGPLRPRRCVDVADVPPRSLLGLYETGRGMNAGDRRLRICWGWRCAQTGQCRCKSDPDNPQASRRPDTPSPGEPVSNHP